MMDRLFSFIELSPFESRRNDHFTDNTIWSYKACSLATLKLVMLCVARGDVERSGSRPSSETLVKAKGSGSSITLDQHQVGFTSLTSSTKLSKKISPKSKHTSLKNSLIFYPRRAT